MHPPFIHNLEVIAKELKMHKGNVKTRLMKYGFAENVDYIKQVEQTSSHKENIYLTKQCFNQLLLHFTLNQRNVTKPSEDLIETKYVKRYIPEEIEIIGFIAETFQSLYKVKRQYYVLKYRVDLYIIDKRIAIECDEHGHRTYDHKKEVQRENDIRNTLQCKFVRFNPHDKNFKLSNLMSQLFRMCMEEPLVHSPPQKNDALDILPHAS